MILSTEAFEPPRLLVVEDEAVQRLIVSRAAEKLGYAASGAGSLIEAARWLQGQSADVVVLDLSLREHDGIEVLREIARLERDPVLILISGFDERVREAAARLAVALGLRVAGTLGKPLALDQLMACIAEVPREKPRTSRARRATLTPGMLDAALDAGEIHCLYQPKIRLSDRRVVGFEALARWHSPTFGTIGPDAFIPLAERYGLIDRITVNVLDRALHQLRAWHDIDPALEMAVNLSPSSLGDLMLPERISDVLAGHGIAPARLILEVTEGALMADYIAAADILTRLRIRGVGIAIDDFGTGHSSLLSLLRLPFSELKIDQRFVMGLLRDPELPKIVGAVISLANSMELKLVAEGIESEPIAERLHALGVTIGQGYLFAQPLGADAATAMLSHKASA